MYLKPLLTLAVVALLSTAGCKSDQGEETPWETAEEEPTPDDVALASLALDPTQATVLLGTERQFAVVATYTDGTTSSVSAEANWSVGNDAIVEVDDGLVTAVAPGSSTVTAHYRDFTADAIVTVPSARPEQLVVSPASTSIEVGETRELTAEATLTDGSTFDATQIADWTSEATDVATVSNDPPVEGTVRGVSSGTTTIRASLADLTAQSTVTVGATAQLAGIEFAPPSLQMLQEQTARVQILGRYSDGRIVEVTTRAALSSSDEAIVTVAGSGVVSSAAAGTARLEAELQGHVASAPVEVTDAEVLGIDVTPAAATTAPGGATDFHATALLDDGTTLDIDESTDWRSTQTAVATVDGSGLARARQQGETTIQARFAGATGTATLDVVDAVLLGIDVEPVDPTAVVGMRWRFTATGRYDGGLIADLSYGCDWSSSNPNALSLQAPGDATANATGTSVVTCEWDGSVGQSTVTVVENDLESLHVEPASATLSVGDVHAFRLVGRHIDGRTSDLTESAIWSADADAVAVSNGPGRRGQATGIAVGNAEIRADFAGLNATATVRVSDAELAALTIDPDPVSVPAGATIPVTALGRFDDGTERDLTTAVTWTTDDDSVATVGNGPSAGRLTGVAPGDATLTAAWGRTATTVDVVIDTAAVERIDIDPADLITTRGLRTNYAARAVYTDGTEVDVTDLATWSIDDGSVAFIGNSQPRGQLVALDVGQTTVRARWSDVEGSTPVTVEGAALESLAITPRISSAAVGVDTQLTAIATYTDGSDRNVTGRAAWTSSLPGVAAVSDTGLVEPIQPGEVQITARFGGEAATATFTVTDASITEVQVIPFNLTIASGDQMWFQAFALFSDGTKEDVTRLARWSSDDDSILQIETVAYLAGVAVARNPGTTTVRANYEGVIGDSNVTVTDATVTDISIFPTSYELAVGTELFMTAEAIYSDGTSRNVNYLGSWSSSEPDVAEIRNAWPNPGLVTAHAPGDTTISITYQGVTATAEITVSDATLEQIQVFPFTASITKGSPTWFQATGVFSDGRSVWLTRDVTWTSSDDTIAAISNGRWSEGRTIGVNPGAATIEATWNGVTGSATVVVTDKQISTIQVTPYLAELPAGYGELFQAVAIFDDATSRNVTQLATWETTDASVASVGNVWWTNGLVLTHAPGQVSVKAIWQGAEGTTTLTVSDALLASIDVEPQNESLLPGEVLEYTATGNFDDGSTLDITLFATWLSSDIDVANVSNAWGYRGEATAFAPGTTDISANNAGVSGATTLEVR